MEENQNLLAQLGLTGNEGIAAVGDLKTLIPYFVTLITFF